MSQNQIEPLARSFFENLKSEIAREAEAANAKHEADRQDGFMLDHIDEGWIEYKGMSLGFVFLEAPPRISFAIGPDGPFVGHKRILKAACTDGQLEWRPMDEPESDDLIFTTPGDLARYAIMLLSNRLHDRSPSIK